MKWREASTTAWGKSTGTAGDPSPLRVLQWASSVYKDMPVYEYRCSDCRKKTAVLVRSFAAETTPACQHCGGSNLSRLISRVAIHKSSGGDDFGNDDFGGLDESDPRAMAGMIQPGLFMMKSFLVENSRSRQGKGNAKKKSDSEERFLVNHIIDSRRISLTSSVQQDV